MEDKKQVAAALKYRHNEDNAPTLLAKGKGEVAERIINTAKEANIHVYEDSALAYQLNKMELGDEINVELYQAVVNILIFIAKIDNSLKK